MVRVATDKASGTEFGCKTINKRLDIPEVSTAKQEQHLGNIQREISVLRKLKGTLNVVFLEEVRAVFKLAVVHKLLFWAAAVWRTEIVLGDA